MRPAEIVKAIENVIEEHKYDGNIGPLRKIETLLKCLRGFYSLYGRND